MRTGLRGLSHKPTAPVASPRPIPDNDHMLFRWGHSEFCAQLRRHHEQVLDRLNDFLAKEQQQFEEAFLHAIRHGPTSEHVYDSNQRDEIKPDADTMVKKVPHPNFLATAIGMPSNSNDDAQWDPWQRQQSPAAHFFEQKEFTKELEWDARLHEEQQIKRCSTFRPKTHLIIPLKRAHPEPDDDAPFQRGAIRLVCSPLFDSLFLGVILVNSLVMGIEVHFEAVAADARNMHVLNAVQATCSVLFLGELLIRLFADRLFFFRSTMWAWNYYDLLLVTSSTIELVVEIVRASSDEDIIESKTLSTARILRILRLTRIARSVRFVRALRVLLLSIMSTLKTVVFAFLLVLVVIYFYAVIFTQAAGNHFSESSSRDQDLANHWGDLFTSMLTLFYCISGGVDWGLTLNPLLSLHPIYGLVLVTYVIIMYFAILNAITGAFCQSAADSQLHDKELQLHDLLESKKGEVRKFVKVFEEIFKMFDADNLGEVDKDNFMQKVQDPLVQELLSTLDLHPEDTAAFFRLVDKDDSGRVDIDKFVTACLQLKGNARSIDLAKNTYDLNMMRKQNYLFMQMIIEQFRNIRSLLPRHDGTRPVAQALSAV